MFRGFTRTSRAYEILTEEQVETIWSRALDVLRVTGVRMEHKQALQLLEKHGCKVDYGNMRVRFPEGLVEEYLRKAPGSWRLRSRDPQRDIILGGNTVHFIPYPGMHTVDVDTWEARPPSRQEFIDATRVLDACENLSCLGNYTPYFGYEGVPPVMAITEGFALNLMYSTKPQFMQGTSNECEIFNIMLAKAVGSEFTGVAASSAPLTYYEDQINVLFRFSREDFPMMAGGGHVMGATGPATFAGSLVLDLATDIAPAVLIQILKPGARTAFGDLSYVLNMRSGTPDFGAIGTSIHQVSRTQMTRKKFPRPAAALAAGVSNSKRIDFQCGYEKAITIMTAAMSGANLIWLHGAIHGELTHHPLQAILDDDIAGMAGRFVQGFDVNDETLAVELIEEIGPVPGHYLSTGHTRDWWKKEQYVQKAADKLTPAEWLHSGKKSALDYAREKMDAILASHKISKPLTAGEEADIERILKEAYAFYRKKGLL